MREPRLSRNVFRGKQARIWLLIGFILVCGPAALFAAHASAQGPQVIAYVFEQKKTIEPGEIAARKLTRINYAFADIQGNRMVTGSPNDAQNMAALVALKHDNPSLAVLISVGGWLWSGKFTDMALTKQSRGEFIDSAVEFIRQYNLDGLDIDWEYPGLPGATNNFRPEDKQSYTALVKELRKRFDHEEKKLHRWLYTSVAVGAQADFLTHTEMNEVQKYVDTVNLMAYDYYEPATDHTTGHHAPLFTNPADPKKISADRSVTQLEQAGVPAAKIVLGVPFYGHQWGEVPDQNNGLYQPGKPILNVFARYNDISGNMLGNGFTRYWDQTASVPYLYNPASKTFVSYEDAESLALKCKYVRDHKLDGIMFWDYEGDSSGVLLDAIDAGLFNSTRAQSGTR